MPDEKLTPEQFAAKVRSKYPGAYDSIPDTDLTQKFIAKYPVYADKVNMQVDEPMVGKVPKRVLDSLRTKSSSPTQFEVNQSQLPSVSDAMKFMVDVSKSTGKDLYESGKVMVNAISQPVGGKSGAFVPPPVKMAINAAKGYYGAEQNLLNTARAEADKGDTTGSMINSVAAGLPVVGPLVGGIYEGAKKEPLAESIGKGQSRILQALTMGGETLPNPVGEVGAAAVKLPSQVRNAVRGRVTANPEPSANLAAMAEKGGQPGQGVSVRDIASPEVTSRFQQAMSEMQKENPALDLSGPDAARHAAEASRRMVAQIETEASRVKSVVDNRIVPAEIRQTIANEIRASKPVTLEPGAANPWDTLAQHVLDAKTGGDLLRLKSDVYQLGKKGSFGNITVNDFSLDAAADTGNAIVRNYYPEISKVTGQNLSPLMKTEQGAIRLQTQLEKAVPKLESGEVVDSTTGFGARVRSGTHATEMVKNAVGMGKPTNFDLFRQNLERVMKSRTAPPPPPVQGPMQPTTPGKYPSEGNPLGPTNPGEGSMNPAGSTRPVPSEGQPFRSPFGSPLADALQRHGGHAGGGVASVEELNRPGIHGVIGKNGQFTYHGKSFAPEAAGDGTHVTIFDDGNFRVNSGTLSEAQAARLKAAIREILKRK